MTGSGMKRRVSLDELILMRHETEVTKLGRKKLFIFYSAFATFSNTYKEPFSLESTRSTLWKQYPLFTSP